MNEEAFLKELTKYAVVRPPTWQKNWADADHRIDAILNDSFKDISTEGKAEENKFRVIGDSPDDFFPALHAYLSQFYQRNKVDAIVFDFRRRYALDLYDKSPEDLQKVMHAVHLAFGGDADEWWFDLNKLEMNNRKFWLNSSILDLLFNLTCNFDAHMNSCLNNKRTHYIIVVIFQITLTKSSVRLL